MTKLIKPAKNILLLEAHPVNMHDEVTEWLSELEFCKTELAFLTKLLNKTFLRTSGKQRLSELSSLDKKVKSFREKSLKEIIISVIRHENHLAVLDENAFSRKEKTIRDEHKKQRLDVRDLMAAVKSIKKEIFDFVERQVKQAKKIRKDYEEGHLIL